MLTAYNVFFTFCRYVLASNKQPNSTHYIRIKIFDNQNLETDRESKLRPFFWSKRSCKVKKEETSTLERGQVCKLYPRRIDKKTWRILWKKWKLFVPYVFLYITKTSTLVEMFVIYRWHLTVLNHLNFALFC